MKVDKPWGYELIWAKTDRYVGKLLHIVQGTKLSLQYHRKKDETVFLQSGRMDLVIQEDGMLKTLSMRPGDFRRIPPGTVHRMIAVETCEVFEVSTTELDDVVRLEDDYGRTASGEGR